VTRNKPGRLARPSQGEDEKASQREGAVSACSLLWERTRRRTKDTPAEGLGRSFPIAK
jgi:hypothetical protein